MADFSTNTPLLHTNVYAPPSGTLFHWVHSYLGASPAGSPPAGVRLSAPCCAPTSCVGGPLVGLRNYPQKKITYSLPIPPAQAAWKGGDEGDQPAGPTDREPARERPRRGCAKKKRPPRCRRWRFRSSITYFYFTTTIRRVAVYVPAVTLYVSTPLAPLSTSRVRRTVL